MRTTHRQWLRRSAVAAAALLCAAAAGVTLWRFWPRSYSPADPRAYVPLEEVPVERPGDLAQPRTWVTTVDALLEEDSGAWDYAALKEYGFQTQCWPATDPEKEEWIAWCNSAILDFLQRVSGDKPAVMRNIWREWSVGDPMAVNPGEIYYVPSWQENTPFAGQFVGTVDHRVCTDTCHQRGLEVSADGLLLVDVRTNWIKGGIGYYIFRPTKMGPDIWYWTGYDEAMDIQMARLTLQLLDEGRLMVRDEYKETQKWRKTS